MVDAPAPRPQSLQDLMRLKLTEHRPEDLHLFPSMTSWFKPVLLSKLLLNVIVSETFGRYADRRLIHAALDKAPLEEGRKRNDLSSQLAASEEGVWIDYIADLGDGFDATYAMAYLVAQPDLKVDGHPDPLPRAGALFMGGDEVYPTASSLSYNAQMRRPYALAWPDTRTKPYPPVFALPGNHDWYDGLSVFLALFCRPKPTSFGNWRSRQTRSYFSAQLTDKWWIWGIDIALVRDMDQPQADYFVDAAEHMPDGANIILCSAEPGWYVAETQGASFRTLDYAAVIASRAKKHLHIPLVLSGDSHHYARYAGAESQFITSGGGGAFLHGTLELKDTIKTNWLKEKDDTLVLKKAYPTPQQSRDLLDQNMAFFALNSEFSYLLGTAYWFFAFVLTSIYRVDTGVIIFLILGGAFWSYSGYQEKQFNWPTLIYSLFHALGHFIVIWGFSEAWLWIAKKFLPSDLPWFVWAALLAVLVIPAGSVVAGKIFGTYLRLTCKYGDRNHNDAFSSMRLDSYRNFLRMHIQGDEITVYSIGLDQVPARDDWKINAARSAEAPSIFEPSSNLLEKVHLVEPPIRIRAEGGLSASEIKPGAEVPKP